MLSAIYKQTNEMLLLLLLLLFVVGVGKGEREREREMEKSPTTTKVATPLTRRRDAWNQFGTPMFWFLDGPPRAKNNFASVLPFKVTRCCGDLGGVVVAILVEPGVRINGISSAPPNHTLVTP